MAGKGTTFFLFLQEMGDFFESRVLFSSHFGLRFWGFVPLPCQMEQTMNNNTMQFLNERNALLISIGLHRIQRDEDIAIDTRTRCIVKSDDIGKVVVLKKLLIDGKNLIVVAKDIVQFAYRKTMIRRYRANPALHLREVDGWHWDIIWSKRDHICNIVLGSTSSWLTEEYVCHGKSGYHADKVGNQATHNGMTRVLDTYAAKING